MPIARFQMPDGRIARFEVDEGTTPEQAQAMMEAHFGGESKPAEAKAAAQEQPGGITSIGAGLGKGLGDVVLGAQRYVGKGLSAVGADTAGEWLVKDAEQGREKLKLENTPYKDAHPVLNGGAEFAGNVVATLPVGGALAGVAKATRVVPASLVKALASSGMTTGVQAAKGVLPALANAGTRALGGAVTGGVTAGLIDPGSAQSGAVIGALLPPALQVGGKLAGTVGRSVQAAAAPFYQRGQEAILGRALNAAAGGDGAAVAQRLNQASAPFVGPSQGAPRTMMGELVPGSLPTVGQAAQNPGIAALERAATATNPEVTNALSAQMGAQNTARVNALEQLAGTDGAREFHAANRAATAQGLYEQAYEKGINLTKNATTGQFASKAEIAGTKGEITKLMSRPAVQEAMADARKLAANEGVKLSDPSGSVKGLDYVKRALDDKISKATGNEQRVLMDLKSRLLTTLDRLSPDYASARKVFTEMSRPINQMDVAGELVKKSVNPLSGNLQPAAYARALSDETAQRATGFGKATLEGVMDPAQLNQLNSVLLDVQRANGAQTVGRGVGSDTVQKLAYTNLLEQAGIPTFLRNSTIGQVAGNLLGRGADVAYGRANRELANKLAEIMMDPAKAAQLMQLVNQPGASNALANALSNPGLRQLGYRSAPALTSSR